MFRKLVDCSYKYLRQQLAPSAIAVFVYVVPAVFLGMPSAAVYGYITLVCSRFYLRCSAVRNIYEPG